MSFTPYCNCGKPCPMVSPAFSQCACRDTIEGWFQVDFTRVPCCVDECSENAIECRFYPRENGKSYPVCVKHAERDTPFCPTYLTVTSKDGTKPFCIRCDKS